MRFYLLDTSKRPHGPYEWAFVRELFAFGAIDGYLACEVGQQQWSPIKSFSKISTLPKSVTDRTKQYSAMLAPSPLTALQTEILHALKAPPFSRQTNRYVVNSLIQQLAEDQKELVDPKLLWRFSVEKNLGWKLDPASPQQRALLKTRNIEVSSALTKGEASSLLSSSLATLPQLGRLRFYGCAHIPGITGEEAFSLIDDYVKLFPESEPEYETWKQSHG